MISRIISAFRIIILTTFLFLTAALNAQTINEVITAYNAGAEFVNTGSFEAAISKFEECIQLANQLGAEGDEMKLKAEGQIPVLYYRIASDKYKEKDIDGAITFFEKTIEACNQYGNEEFKGKSINFVAQLYNTKGNTHFKNEELDKALASFDKSIFYKPDYAKAYYGKGLVYKKMNDEANMLSMLDKAIETGKTSADDKTTEAAVKTIRDYYVIGGVNAMKTEDYETAFKCFDASMKYDDKYSEPYYRLAVIYNKQLEYDKAAENALKAIEYDNSESEKKARLYFELGNAYVGMVEYQKACDAFKNARYEPYTSNVKYKMENVLKCE
jgi:tetratricopeptide (TPR) repeat protein